MSLKKKTMLIAVNFHYVRPVFDALYPGIHGLTPARFEAQLKVLGALGEFVSLDQVREFVRGKAAPACALLITFDDGLREQYQWAWPILQKLGVPAAFFVNTAPLAQNTVLTVHKIHLLRSQVAPIEFLVMLRRIASEQGTPFDPDADKEIAVAQYRYDTPEAATIKYLLNFKLDWAERDRLVNACFSEVSGEHEAKICDALYMTTKQIEVLADAGCIGSHTHSHLPLGLLDEERCKREIEDAGAHLERWTGARPFAMSYPYGSQNACSPQSATLAAAADIEFAFTMERAANLNFEPPLFLARFDSNDVPGGTSWRGDVDEFFAAVPAARWYRE